MMRHRCLGSSLHISIYSTWIRKPVVLLLHGGIHANHLLKGCHLDHLTLVPVHHCLAVPLSVDLLREELQHKVHHHLSVEVTGVHQMVHVKTLAMI